MARVLPKRWWIAAAVAALCVLAVVAGILTARDDDPAVAPTDESTQTAGLPAGDAADSAGNPLASFGPADVINNTIEISRTVSAPTFSIDGGIYNTAQAVTFQCATPEASFMLLSGTCTSAAP